ncbi:hypothetical protein LCGC14_1597050 [marine sediment metagenome]|uniref:Uncharacterized protein n=1 Tax=marine sediment metagenome TaxID=412755 RepID=A0A0F9LCK4_9ZZZZ
MRAPIDMMGTTSDVVYQMSEGIIRAGVVLTALITEGHPLLIASLDDMNIRGSQIWIGYKDHCGEKIQNFIQCIQDRCPDMVNTINAEYLEEQAVTDGASFL